MGITIGATAPTSIHIGATSVTEVYVGATKVWPTGGPALWTPADIQADLVVWFDADDATTITDDVNGVSAWADKSNNGFDAVQSVNSHKPTYDSANGKLDFNEDWLNLNAPYAAATPLTLFSVFEFDSGFKSTLYGMQSADNSRHLIATDDSSYTQYLTRFGTAPNKKTFGAIPAGGQILAAAFHSSGSYFRVNADDIVPLANMGTANMTSGGHIGGSISRADLAMHGHIREFIIVDGVASQATYEKMEGYLAHKWGLAANLPAAHPYKASAP